MSSDVNSIELQKLLKRTLWELALFLFFLVTTCIGELTFLKFGQTLNKSVSVSIGNVGTSLYFCTDMLNRVFVDKNFRTEHETETNFRDLTSIDEFWEFADIIFLEELNDRQMYRDFSNIMNENILLGTVRLRQLRVRNDSCTVPGIFKNLFSDCYDFYSSSSQDQRSFGLKAGTAWTYHTSQELDGFFTWAKFQFYPGSGYFQELTESCEKNRLILQNLHENGWINRGTRAVFIEFTIYNPNINVFCVTKFIVEVLPTGGLITSTNYQIFNVINLSSAADCILLMFELIFVVQICLYSWNEGKQMKLMRWSYFRYMWNIIDSTILLISYVVIGFSIFRVFQINRKMSTFKEDPEKFINFDAMSFMQILFLDTLGVLTFLIWIRTLKYVSFNKTMIQFGKTLKNCAKDIAGFGFMFLIVFVAYAQLGFILFGSQISDFRSFHDAVFTLLRTILGDFDYLAIEKANRVLGPLYFLSYIFFVFFVLLNMFLAIINDTYSEVKASAKQEVLPIGKFMKANVKKMLKRKRVETKETSWIEGSVENEQKFQQKKENFDEIFEKATRNGQTLSGQIEVDNVERW